MPHPDAEHGLQIQLATALREVELWKLAKSNCAESNRRLREALAAARRECEELKAKVMMHELARSLESSACAARAAPGAASGEEG